MNCLKCGKELTDDAVFCTYCGQPTGLAPKSNAPESAPVQQPVCAAPAQPVPAENAALQCAPSQSIPPESTAVQSAYTPPVQQPAYPAPESAPVQQSEPAAAENNAAQSAPIQQMNSAPMQSAAPQSVPVQQAGSYTAPVQQPAESADDKKPEKYYTFGHIALCLAAVAVMAVVAGIFAGLYFSTL